ncbi:MAG: hypothetical protein PHE17_18800 [Thiothrix sp.]|uniref:hypothetical protein n=1 Tax=Thiothrix sp. TaxID=1032 RepID=UPI0026256180|nr:hypothetical protein [Thiothrix sp.]MDD5395074.1 hypothetical protein [Thiothrix sp.]
MRYQWVDAVWRLDYSELKNALLKHPYTEEAGSGFILDEAYRNNKLSGRYIQKEVKTIESRSPLGYIETYFQTIYQNHSFQIDMDSPYSLLLIDPPKSSIPLTSALGRATSFKISIQSPSINLVTWLDLIRLNLKKYSLQKLDIAQVKLSNNILGNLSLKGDGDLLEELKKIPNNTSGKIIRAEFYFSTEDGEGRATITYQGVAKVHNTSINRYFIQILKNTLNDVAKTRVINN